MNRKTLTGVPTQCGFNRTAFKNHLNLKRMRWPVNVMPLVIVVCLMAFVVLCFVTWVLVGLIFQGKRLKDRIEEESALDRKWWSKQSTNLN